MCKSSLHNSKYNFKLTNSLKYFFFLHKEQKFSFNIKKRGFVLSFLFRQWQLSTPTHRVKTTREPDSLSHCHLCQKNYVILFLQLIMLVCEFPCRYKPITVFIFFIKYVFNQSIMLGVIYHCSMPLKFFLQVNFHLLDKS